MFRKVKVAVRERLHGSEDRESIEVLAATRPQFSKTNQGPWNALKGSRSESARTCCCCDGQRRLAAGMERHAGRGDSRYRNRSC